jgi:hypothetical protein
MPDDSTAELRGPCPRKVVDMLDAVSGARGLNRMQLVNEILLEWARRRLHESTVVARVMRINPEARDSGWGGVE